MAHQIIVTSAPRGLDGGDGYQAVLRSQGLPPRVAERLKFRSGYSHPFPHGDKRNPVVYLHRIEDVGGARWHVLGCIRDVGSDHTGRSNFLAHMLAIDSAEARKKTGGPAAVAAAKSCFRDRWEGPPESAAAAKVLVGSDDAPRAGDCPAWQAAGLDPGLAGDLAQAAMEGKRVVLVSRPGDDVLALFADAMRLVEPAKRWGVTFNTCAIEDFEGTWKAIRNDLPAARHVREARDPVIDLAGDPKGSGNGYAQFARGAVDHLPWQRTVTAPADDEELSLDDGSEAAGSVAPRGATRKTAGTKVVAADRAESGRRPPASGVRGRPQRDDEPEPSVFWKVLGGVAVAVSLLLLAVAYVQRDRIVALVSDELPSETVELPEDRPLVPERPPVDDGKNTEKYRKLERIAEAKEKLAAGVNGRKYQQVRGDAETLQADYKDFVKSKSAAVIDAEKKGDDYLKELSGIIAACDEVEKLLAMPDGELTVEALEAAAEKLAAAEANRQELTNSLKHRQNEAEKERQRLADMAKKAEDKARGQRAYEGFLRLPDQVPLPVAVGADIGGAGSAVRPEEIDLGEFIYEDLIDLKFRLAIPRDTIDGKPFRATIEPLEPASEGERKWLIQYQPQDAGFDGVAQKPRTLAKLVARDRRLKLEPPRRNELASRPFALLRRSVILAEATDPAGGPPVVREIRLVKPEQIGLLKIDPLGERQSFTLAAPAGVASSDRPAGQKEQVRYAWPVASIEIKADLAGRETIAVRLPEDAQAETDTGIGNWTVMLMPLHQDPDVLSLAMQVRMALREGVIAVQPQFVGLRAKQVTIDQVNRNFIKQPEDALRQILAAFDRRIKNCPGHEFETAKTAKGENDIRSWLAEPLATEQKMSMAVAGHETVAKSFESYLKDRYAKEELGLNQRRQQGEKNVPERPERSKDGEEWLDKCKKVSDEGKWAKQFSEPLYDWAANWFRPKFEAQWEEYVSTFQGVLKMPPSITIQEITSLAYDEAGKVYPVPLMEFDPKQRPQKSGGPNTSRPDAAAGGPKAPID